MAEVSNYKIDMQVEKAQFEKKLKKLAELTKKSPIYWANEGAKAFLQSTVKATPAPPRMGKTSYPKTENDNLRQVLKGTINKRPVYVQGVAQISYVVPFKTTFNKGWKYFPDKAKAKEFSVIRNRGLSKWAWVTAGQDARINASYGYKFNSYVQRHTRFGDGGIIKNTFEWKSAIFLKNSVKGISNYGFIAAKKGMRAAKNRMTGLIRELKKQARQQWA